MISIPYDLQVSHNRETDSLEAEFIQLENISNNIIIINKKLYICDGCELIINDNGSDRPYHRRIETRAILNIRRGNEVKTFTSSILCTEASDKRICFYTDEEGSHITLGKHISTLSAETITKITSGILVGDTVAITGSKTEKIVVGFKKNNDNLYVRWHVKDSRSANPSINTSSIDDVRVVAQGA